jgi:hypothetical protein
MTNRTIQFFGQGYGTVAINANVQIDGNTVFTGEIPTVDQPQSRLPKDQVKIFEVELPVDTVGSVPVSILFTGEEMVYVLHMQANYVPVKNPVYTPEQLSILIDPDSTLTEKLPIFESVANPPLTSADILVLQNGTPEEKTLVLTEHNLKLLTSGPDLYGPLLAPRARTNVVVDGVAVTPGNDPPGEWGWPVILDNGTGTMTFNLHIPPPLE